MNDERRPNPDEILRAISSQEERSSKGRLRIFFGMAAGVGKTYAMLEAAREQRKEGVNAAIGIVETHGRKETEALMEGIPLVPRKRIIYKGAAFEEMDLDGLLALRPDIALVDELAHTNVPGSRHNKRYQDVLELLDSGIDVYTTLNAQHLESRKDIVEEITGVKVRETVPDSMLERADQVELVDITPAELLKRLKEGKVYLGERAEMAAKNFFREESLTALREIALRLTAERVDHELQRYQETSAVPGPWRTNERMMVAISHSPYSERLIRTTRRIAYNLESPWVAVYVDTGAKLSDKDQAQLAKNLALARELGAEVLTTTESDIAEALRKVARRKNVTQIIVGRPTRRWIREALEGGSLLDRLVRESWDVDVHVIRQDGEPPRRPLGLPRLNMETGGIAYWNTLIFFLGIAFLSGLAEPLIGFRAVGFVFLLGVLLVGLVGSVGPVFFAATLSTLIWNFFFIPPRMTFAVHAPEDLIMCFTYFVVAIITGALTTRIRRHEELIREREERTGVLYEVLKDISSSRDPSEFLDKSAARMGHVLGGSCMVLLKSDGGKLKPVSAKVPEWIDEKERAVAEWVFDKGKAAGWSTETLSQAKNLYVPLRGNDEPVGVFVYHPSRGRKLALDQENLLFSVCRQLGLSIERRIWDQRLREAEKLEASEKLHQTLLNSVSHEMRTPLTAIMGSASALEDDRSPDTREFRKAMAHELVQAGDRLNRVIENLLDMTRLSSGALAIKREWHVIHDLIGVTLQRLGRNLDRHAVEVDFPDELPLVEIDFRLLEHALSNILLNAAIYTPPGTTIRVSARKRGTVLEIMIEDSGAGVPDEALPLLFEKFYRAPGTPTGGTGLGLSIAKSIIEFHKGEIKAENREGGGLRFVIELPLGAPPEVPEEFNRKGNGEANGPRFDH